MKDGGFDTALLETGELIKRSFFSLIGNVGRTIAVITLAVASLVTFTDVGFHDLKTASFTSRTKTVKTARITSCLTFPSWAV